MALTPAKDQAIKDAMLTHAMHPVELELDVQQLLMVIGGLQLALRHPEYPAESRRFLRTLIKGWRDGLWSLDTNLAHLVDYGFMHEHDLPMGMTEA